MNTGLYRRADCFDFDASAYSIVVSTKCNARAGNIHPFVEGGSLLGVDMADAACRCLRPPGPKTAIPSACHLRLRPLSAQTCFPATVFGRGPKLVV